MTAEKILCFFFAGGKAKALEKAVKPVFSKGGQLAKGEEGETGKGRRKRKKIHIYGKK